jgi:uncharacterized flavoprotein (TIGR03862 family)
MAAAPAHLPFRVAVIGAGPAGLMAAEVMAEAGAKVTVHERMPSVGRKLLMAGRGGLNLTHSEPFDAFLGRYAEAADRLAPMLRDFPPSALVAWAEGLGQPTFVGSSGRVFPQSLKASPLLRAWTRRLDSLGVEIRTRHAWLGWDADGALRFETPRGEVTETAAAVVLALGGASWPRLGSTGGWADILAARGVELSPFEPANGGFSVNWTAAFRERFAGQPLKGARLSFAGRFSRSEAMITGYGIEGGGVYALGADLRAAIDRDGAAELMIDLRPDLEDAALAARLAAAPAGQSLSNRLRKAAKLTPLAAGLLRETHARLPSDAQGLARAIKAAPLRLTGSQPIARAISTAGGVRLDQLDDRLMLKALPGVFCAGEMLDWEAPTGGYLLQACFATGVAAGKGALAWLAQSQA